MGIFSKKKKPTQPADPVKEGVEPALFAEYQNKVMPVEDRHLYNQFYTPSLRMSEFKAKPSVLFLGQYSVGKTTMIEFLLGKPYPGARTGPEPTTDAFVVISYGESEQAYMGNAVVTMDDFPLQSLEKFGDKFLAKLRGVTTTSQVLRHINLIDTPGILSGEKQRLSRGYDFDAVVRFLAEKVDVILMLFDTSKLDVSDEFKKVIQNMGGNEEKVKVVLNKADSVSAGELIHVRGALMWNLSKIMRCAEIPKVYIGSYWPNKLQNAALRETFRSDYTEILKVFCELPNSVRIRKINDVARRAKAVRIHALLMEILLQKRLLGRKPSNRAEVQKITQKKYLQRAYITLQERYRVNEFDLPDIGNFQRRAMETDGPRWRKVDKVLMAALEEFLAQDIAKMLRHLPDRAKQAIDVGPLQQSVLRFADVGKKDDTKKNSPKREQKSEEERPPLKKEPPSVAEKSENKVEATKEKEGKKMEEEMDKPQETKKQKDHKRSTSEQERSGGNGGKKESRDDFQDRRQPKSSRDDKGSMVTRNRSPGTRTARSSRSKQSRTPPRSRQARTPPTRSKQARTPPTRSRQSPSRKSRQGRSSRPDGERSRRRDDDRRQNTNRSRHDSAERKSTRQRDQEDDRRRSRSRNR